ncbi:hypothetical protein ASU91_00345 [Enterobacter hormaechei subsp. steigerwaltii]|uniref:glycosyltransferase family 4 protein n=2 Tax=Enterobacter hormaechei TaxID=158836 RepID=UPI0005ED7724|nr:glycosyltransferase family 1 protein [Enterobacter hormaechei]AXO52047.1 glycosyltransferase family 1 protein [Enterobacter hormaechei]ELC6537298.1 glycosyltransferase family 4 protein [Enterobacter hormaechei]ELW9370132.1 glycosyltransferase family 4 protein [Enterobacter hormaechei]EMD5646439.1 glycosyltransferase family 4 protein [Enterobacter hormaechei]KJL75862.1 hypothetical protein SS35_10565 [Enterobacter hormaechei subsp. steigerwaltii]
MKKKLYIDGYFLTQRITGVQRYAEELISNMRDIGYEIVILAPRNASRIIPGVDIRRNKFLNGLLWQQFYLPIYLFFLGAPVITSFSGLGPILYKNKLLAIHDGSLYRYPEFFSFLYRLIYKGLYPITIFFSKGLITVSEFSKNEIKKFITARKQISVINNVVTDLHEENSHDTNTCSTKKYLLTVGSLDKRKNLARIIEAFLKANLDPDYNLYIVGGAAKSFTEMGPSTIAFNSRVKFLGYIPDKELSTLYRNAQGFLYLSLYEGFGIPPLEALVHDCPVLLSDIDVFRELYGKEFYLVDPLDTELIANAIEEFSRIDRAKILASQKKVLSIYTKVNQIQQFENVIGRYICE